MRGLFFPFKTTQKVDILNPLNTHITKKYSSEAASSIFPTLNDMQKLRDNIEFVNMQTRINNDVQLAAQFQNQLVNYLNYTYFIDNFFKADFSNTLKINFIWSDSFQPSKKAKAINHIKYEIASCLYNLAVCYYLEAKHCSMNPTASEKLKAIAKFRNAVWCVIEIKQVLSGFLADPSEVPSDLNLSFLNLFNNYLIGLTYGVLVDITGLDPQKIGTEKLASINKAASRYFQIAHDIVAAFKQPLIPEPQCKILIVNLQYNIAVFRSDAYYHIAKSKLKNVDEEILKGWMGYAVSYLRIPKGELEALLKNRIDLDNLKPLQRAELLKKTQIINELYDGCLAKNQKVYKQTEYRADQLPEIPEEKAAILPIEPKDIKKKLNEEDNFQAFLSPNILAIRDELAATMMSKVQEVENTLKKANNVKEELYINEYVNYLLDLESKSLNNRADVQPQLETQIEKFKKNGGHNAFLFTRKNIMENNKNFINVLQELRSLITVEKEEDDYLRKQYPNKWTRSTSEQVNQEYENQLKGM